MLAPCPLAHAPRAPKTALAVSISTALSASASLLKPDAVLLLEHTAHRFLLIQNPEAEAKVLQELQSVGVPCDGDSGAAAAALSLDLLKQLPYCTAVLQEAMRMFPAGVMAASR